MNGTEERSVVMVTGGSRGIGAEIVKQCLAAGKAVCFTYSHDKVGAYDLIKELGEPAALLAVRADVTDPLAMDTAFDVAGSLGRVTAVVNNAAVTGKLGRFVDVPPDEMARVVDVNLVSPLRICQMAVQRWSADPAGPAGCAIVNISSIAATLGAPHEYIPYAASKAGLDTMTVGLAKEVAALGIRVNAVAPGTADTGIHAAAGDPDRPTRVVSRIPMGRIGQPREIAEAVTWLLSEKASYVTGAILRVSGGL